MTISLRFVTGRDLVSAGIRRAQMGFPYSHVDVAMPDGSLVGAHLVGGVEARPANYDAAARSTELRIDVPASAAQSDAARAFLIAQIGKPYDALAILDMAAATVRGRRAVARAPDGWRDRTSWFCSELATAALEAAGLLPFGVPVGLRSVTPENLFFMLIPLAPPHPQDSAPS